MEFHEDNQFLVEPFLLWVEDNLNRGIITIEDIKEAKNNKSYWDFYIQKKEYIITPLDLNFSFKYLDLLKKHSPDYFKGLENRWKKYIPKNLYNILEYKEDIEKSILAFDNSMQNNIFGVLPSYIESPGTLIYRNFKDLKEIDINNPIEINLFKKMYQEIKPDRLCINGVQLFLFPINITSFYRIQIKNKKKKLVLVEPKWNAFRWSTVLPNFIIDKEGSKNKKYLNKNNLSQEIIDLQMGI